jgi:ketopantoate reductase
MNQGRYIEFENLVGEPMREAKLVGVPTPKLAAIYEMCKAYQWKIGIKKGDLTMKLPSTAES